MSARQNCEQRVLYMVDCSSNTNGSDVQACLPRIQTTLREPPPNSTHLVQPADSFIIQKIMEAWKQKWESLNTSALSRESGCIPTMEVAAES